MMVLADIHLIQSRNKVVHNSTLRTTIQMQQKMIILAYMTQTEMEFMMDPKLEVVQTLNLIISMNQQQRMMGHVTMMKIMMELQTGLN